MIRFNLAVNKPIKPYDELTTPLSKGECAILIINSSSPTLFKNLKA